MPVRSVKSTDAYVEINSGGRIFHFDYADIPANFTLNEQKAEHLRQFAQDWLDERIKVKDLPADDPARLADPARPDWFWEGQGGNKELVARPIIIEDITWDGTKFNFTLRRNR